MTTAPSPTSTDLDQSIDPAIRSAVSQQLLQLDKTLRASQLYLANNPMYQTALDRLRASFRQFWQDHDDLALGIDSNGFQYLGEHFENDPEHPESFSWLLYRDGLRSLTLGRGCEDDELIQFLDVVNQARKTLGSSKRTAESRDPGHQRGDDLLTLLWPCEFAHIQYEFVEPQNDDYAPLEPSGDLKRFGTPQDIQEQVRDDTSDGAPDGIVQLDESAATLYFLEEKEIERLKHEIDEEYRTELHTHVASILFDIFEHQTFSKPQDEIVGLLETLIPNLLVSGEYDVVAYILRESRAIAERGKGPPTAITRLQNIPATISSPSVLNDLLQLLDDSPGVPPRGALSELLGQLRPEAIGTILDWIPRLRNSTVKGILSLAMDPIAKTNPRQLIQSLADLGPSAIVAALEIIERLALRSVANDVIQFAGHDDAGVRQAAATALAALATPASMIELTKLIGDPDRDVRKIAVEKVGEAKFVNALSALETAMKTVLRDAPLSEKRVYFRAFAALSGEKGVKHLNDTLNAKRLLRRREDPDTRACAAMALGVIGSLDARRALERALKDDEPIVRNAADQALRELTT